MTFKKSIGEYKRVMGGLDTTDEVRQQIIDGCLEATGRKIRNCRMIITAGAISGAAAAATALGLVTYMKRRNRA